MTQEEFKNLKRGDRVFYVELDPPNMRKAMVVSPAGEGEYEYILVAAKELFCPPVPIYKPSDVFKTKKKALEYATMYCQCALEFHKRARSHASQAVSLFESHLEKFKKMEAQK